MSARVRESTTSFSHFIYHKGMIEFLIESQLRRVGRTWEHFLFWGGLKLQPAKPKSGRKKGSKMKVKHPQKLEQGTSSIQERIQQKVETIPPLVPKLTHVYTRRSDRLRKIEDAPPLTIPLHAKKEVNKKIDKSKGKIIDPEVE